MHPHMLRHTYVTTMLDAGVSLRDVQIAARHADPRTTMRYDRARRNLDRHPVHPPRERPTRDRQARRRSRPAARPERRVAGGRRRARVCGELRNQRLAGAVLNMLDG
jgi:hypothetical protein